jgi:hypothetical protein
MSNEVSKEETETRIEKVKRHIRENRNAYVVGGVCLTIGIIVGAIVGKKYSKTVQIFANVANVIEDGDENTIVSNAFYQRVSKYGRPLGRHGNSVREIDPYTGRTIHEYATQLLAARDAGVSNSSMSRHLDGKFLNLNGRTFERMDLEWLYDDMNGMFDY